MPSLFQTNRPRTLYASLAILLPALIFGGASRLEVGTTILPRLAAIAALGYFLWQRNRSPLTIPRHEIVFWIMLFALPIVQLIPLPWSWWTGLPGRGLEKIVFDTLGERPEMPISLAPERTKEFVLALTVPLAAYVTGKHLDYDGRNVVLRAMLICGVISSAIGLLQIVGGPGSSLYFYSITNSDSSVGLFSNANHFSLFLSIAIVIALVWLGDCMAKSGKVFSSPAIVIGVSILGMLFAVAGTGSRAGAIFSVVAILAGLAMLPLERVGVRRSRVIYASISVFLVLSLLLTLVLNGTLLSGRFTLEDGDERYNMLPIYGHIVHDFFPVGSGLGSFEPVFKTYEKAETLSFGYMNQAHNEFAQTAIEAGLVGIVMIVLFLVWFAARIVLIWRPRIHPLNVRRQQECAALIMGLTILHSAVDYPMRTSAIAAIFAFCAAFLTAPDSRSRRRTLEPSTATLPGPRRDS